MLLTECCELLQEGERGWDSLEGDLHLRNNCYQAVKDSYMQSYLCCSTRRLSHSVLCTCMHYSETGAKKCIKNKILYTCSGFGRQEKSGCYVVHFARFVFRAKGSKFVAGDFFFYTRGSQPCALTRVEFLNCTSSFKYILGDLFHYPHCMRQVFFST